MTIRYEPIKDIVDKLNIEQAKLEKKLRQAQYIVIMLESKFNANIEFLSKMKEMGRFKKEE